jgi:hypothetical protein
MLRHALLLLAVMIVHPVVTVISAVAAVPATETADKHY